MESLMDPRSRRHLDTYVMLALVALLAVSGGYVEGQQDRELPGS